jgi:Asp-tRNA(Asn)/Glu-tRNA(Gln) amidotransferase A subunit family amidase
MAITLQHLSEDEIRSLSASIDLHLSDEQLTAYARQINNSLGWYEELDAYGHSGEPSHPTPTDIRYNPDAEKDPLNAFITRFSLSSSSTGGKLDGMDIAIKDNIAVAGVPMTCGSRTFEGVVPQRHATVVKRLLDAGANLVGKTNMDELAYGPTGETSQFGPTHNPVDPDHVTGGSSSGSGAAVGNGDVDAALGSDTGGSVRIPAAFCGAVGVKPSWGVVPRFGFVELAYTLDHIGPIAKDIDTAAVVMDAIAGVDRSDPSSERSNRLSQSFETATSNPSDIESLSIGLPQEFFDDHVSDDVRDVIDTTVDATESAGATIEKLSIPTVADAVSISNAIMASEFAATIRARGVPLRRNVASDVPWQDAFTAALHTHGHNLGDIVKRKLIEGTYLLEHYDGRHYVRARAGCRKLQDEFAAAFDEVDILLTPTLPVVAPEIGEWSADSYGETVPIAVNTRPVNLAGLPAVTLPAGTREGLPVGLQIIGPAYEDPQVLAAARAIEDVS